MNSSPYSSMQKTYKEIKAELKELFFLKNQNFNNSFAQHLQRNLKKLSVKSYFIYCIYQYIQHTNKYDGLQYKKLEKEDLEDKLMVIMEVIMLVMTYHQILKNQLSTKSHDSNIENFKCSSNIKDYVYDCVDQNFSLEEAPLVHKYVRKMFRCVDNGLYFDKFNNYETFYYGKEISLFQERNETFGSIINMDSIKNIFKDIQQYASSSNPAISTYFERNYLISSSLFRFTTELLIEIVQYKGEEKENITQFAECYGLVIQLVNDNCDFVKETNNDNDNRFSILNDLKNEIITLPILLHLKKGLQIGLVSKALKVKGYKIEGKHNLILKEIITSGALPDAMKMGRLIAVKAKFLLNTKNKAFSSLEDLLSIAFNNKYYSHIFHAKKLYLKNKDNNNLYLSEEGTFSKQESISSIDKEIKLHPPTAQNGSHIDSIIA